MPAGVAVLGTQRSRVVAGFCHSQRTAWRRNRSRLTTKVLAARLALLRPSMIRSLAELRYEGASGGHRTERQPDRFPVGYRREPDSPGIASVTDAARDRLAGGCPTPWQSRDRCRADVRSVGRTPCRSRGVGPHFSPGPRPPPGAAARPAPEQPRAAVETLRTPSGAPIAGDVEARWRTGERQAVSPMRAAYSGP